MAKPFQSGTKLENLTLGANNIQRHLGTQMEKTLSRTLKRDTGMTPTTYRQKHQAD
jgi:methylphosphotriester-DNA--protein-cysteine methyltransferase